MIQMKFYTIKYEEKKNFTTYNPKDKIKNQNILFEFGILKIIWSFWMKYCIRDSSKEIQNSKATIRKNINKT